MLKRIVGLLALAPALALAAPRIEISTWVARNVAPGPKVRITINTRNAPMVHVSLYRLNGTKCLMDRFENIRKRPSVSGAPVMEWNVGFPQQKPAYNQRDLYYSRQLNLPILEPGIYLLSVTKGAVESWKVVCVTNLAVMTKRSRRQALVWVTDAKTGDPVPGAAVALYGKKNAPVASGTTNAEGIVSLKADAGTGRIIVSKGKDIAGVSNDNENPDGRLVAHFQTDRPIYRPGHTVYFKAIMRRTKGIGYAPLSNAKMTVQLMDPKSNLIDQYPAQTNASGSVAGKFDVPTEGMLGQYTIVLKLSDQEQAYQSFAVEEYRKPEYKVEVAPAGKRYLAGQEATFRVNANYYFGVPVSQAAVTYNIQRTSNAFWPASANDEDEEYDDGNLYEYDTYSYNDQVANGTVYTDKDGMAEIKFTTDAKAPDSNYQISVTVSDASRRQVTADGSVPVYTAELRLGLSTDLVYAPLGSLFPVSVRAIDLDGKPTPAEVKLTVKAPRYVEKEGRYQWEALTSTTVRVPASGKASINLPAKEEGDIVVEAEAKDGTGRLAKATMHFWVVSAKEKPAVKDEPPSLTIKLDKKSYLPGDTVKAFVSLNNAKRPILLTLEGEDIFSYRVVPKGTSSFVWSIKTSKAMSPNAFVCAFACVDLQQYGANKTVNLPNEDWKINLKVVSDKPEYRPGDKAVYTLTTTDAKGRPIPAEVSMTMVDEAIYALRADTTTELHRFFWAPRPNAVTSAFSAPQELSGGAYQGVAMAEAAAPMGGMKGGEEKPKVVVRTRFEDTAYWNPVIVTDANGRATVTVDMPGNLTTWRTTAYGVTSTSQAGTGRHSVKANRDAMLRLATPRQMVQGDQVTLVGTIDNRVAEDHEFEVRLEGKGIDLTGEAVRRVRVPGKSQGKVEWVLTASQLPAAGSVKLLGTLNPLDAPAEKTADLSDALEVSLKVVPRGVLEHGLAGGTLQSSADVELRLPEGRIEPASKVKITVWQGFGAAFKTFAEEILKQPRYGSVGAANHLIAATLLEKKSDDKDVREALALISKNQQATGWGWWQGTRTSPSVTAKVAAALGYARVYGVDIYANLLSAAQEACDYCYKQTNLWEHRAIVASASVLAGSSKALGLVNEVRNRGENLSPYARLMMAEVYALSNDRDSAVKLLDSAMANLSDGPSEAYLPCGDGIEWNASAVETTAQGLVVLLRLDAHPDIQRKLATWLIRPTQNRWDSECDKAAIMRALHLYVKKHPEDAKLGNVKAILNGKEIAAVPSRAAESASLVIASDMLAGANRLTLTKDTAGEALYSVETSYYMPSFEENQFGVRVLRRFEARNPAGVWEEVTGTVKTADPIRCTVIIWGDDISDAMKVVEPIPAGFEYVDSEYAGWWRNDEVRDGAVVHYLDNASYPQIFRYYIRAENEGKLVALPAFAEYLRRPVNRGQTQAVNVVVVAKEKR